MQKLRQFAVGPVIIRKDRDKLLFDGTKCAQDPIHVMLAMVAVARYLKWLQCVGQHSVTVTASKSGRTVYVNHREIMNRCGTGNTDWVCLERWQIQGLVNDYNNGRVTDWLIPENTLSVIGMLEVKKLENFVVFEEDDYLRADEAFVNFMENNCKEAGDYAFDIMHFKKETKLPTEELVWNYLTKRFADHPFEGKNGKMYILKAYQAEDIVNITVA